MKNLLGAKKILILANIVIGVAMVTWSLVNGQTLAAIINAFMFLLASLFFWKINLAQIFSYLILAIIVVASVFINVKILPAPPNSEKDADQNAQEASSYEKEEPTAGGEILVEGETGTLKNKGTWSYIGTSARGGEAYLGDKNAEAEYLVPATAGGSYTLWVKLSDDGLHSDGTRSATIYVNGQKLTYEHVSEDTTGWKWYQIGSASLAKGANTIRFVKNADTSAAYVMDAFKLLPVK